MGSGFRRKGFGGGVSGVVVVGLGMEFRVGGIFFGGGGGGVKFSPLLSVVIVVVRLVVGGEMRGGFGAGRAVGVFG